jgi:predicted acylesterase/phospholipase RssA
MRQLAIASQLRPSLPVRKWIALASLSIFLAACSTAPFHTTIPEEASNDAVVSGFDSNIRFWADESPPNLGELIMTRIDSYRAAHADYYKEHNSYPPLHYLAISGGAYDGAFGAGLLTGWSASGNRPDFAIVTGISTGSLIAPFVFIGPKYDAKVKELFTTATNDTIFMSSIFDVIDGVTGGLALTDNAPLADRIAANITPEIMAEIAAEHKKGKRLFIGTTNMEAQRGVIWDIGAIASSGNPNALKLIHQVILASAAIPGVFKPVFIDVEAGGKHYSEIHADGGVVSQVFIYPLKLQRSVIDEFIKYKLERHVYVVRNSKINPEYKALEPEFFSLSRRSIETLTKYQGIGDLYRLYVDTQRDGIDFNLTYIPPSFNEKPKELFDPSAEWARLHCSSWR